jgi:hypothetical protein
MAVFSPVVSIDDERKNMNHRHPTLFGAASCFLCFSSVAAAQPPAQAPRAEVSPPIVTEAKGTEVPATGRWHASVYGFVEFDGMYDTTQSFGDSPGNAPILRSDGSRPAYLPVGTDELKGVMYAATHGRLQATARNTRFGLKVTPPEVAGINTSGVLEFDLFGNQPSSPPTTSEGSFFTSPTLRLRHAYLKVQNANGNFVNSLLMGQYYNLFGWQPNFFPGTLSFLGTPNMIFGRTPQVRYSGTVRTSPIDFEFAGAATRPPQRDSGVPGIEWGLRLQVNGWKGPHGRGSGQPTLDGAQIGVSGVLRKFRVIAFSNNRGDITQATEVAEAGGSGLSLDALIPIIPASDLENRSIALTFTGAFVKGQGIADLYTGGLTGGVQFPLAAGPGGPSTGFYAGNIDPGLVQYRITNPPPGPADHADLRVIDWESEMVGAQLYLPPETKLTITANYARGKSDNIGQDIPEGGDPARTFKVSEYYDANIFVDVTPAVRLAASYQYIRQRYVDNGWEKNHRGEIAGLFFF